MVRQIDTRRRLNEILFLIIETYIEDPTPVSSKHLCDKYRLPYSSATIRHVMEHVVADLHRRGLGDVVIGLDVGHAPGRRPHRARRNCGASL